jgi:phage regulator Rha-like protein
MKNDLTTAIPIEQISGKILLIRGQKVMLDRDLAELYGVEVKQLKRAVRRNIDRFPGDFMFEFTKEEQSSLRYHFGTLKRGEHAKYLSFAFTEQGVAMLSSVLKSKRAVEVNILIMRAFVRMRELLYSDKNLALKVEKLEKQMDKHGKSLQQVIQIINQLLKQPEPESKKIGFNVEDN